MSAYTNSVGWLILAPVAIFGILFAGLMIVSFRSVYRSLDVFMVSLLSVLLIDVVILVCMQAAIFVRGVQWTKSSCEFYTWCSITLRCAEIFTVIALSIDRVLILHLNIRYKYRGSARVQALVFILWVAAMFMGVIPIVGWKHVTVMTTGACAYLAFEIDHRYGLFMVIMELFMCCLSAGCLLDVVLHMRHLARHAFFTSNQMSSVYSVDITMATRGGGKRGAPSRVQASLGFSTAYDNCRLVCVLSAVIFMLNHLPYIIISLIDIVSSVDATISRLVTLWCMLLEAIIVPHLLWLTNRRYRQRAMHVVDALLGRDTFFDDDPTLHYNRDYIGDPDELYLESFTRRKSVVPSAKRIIVVSTDNSVYQIEDQVDSNHVTVVKKSNDVTLIKKSRSPGANGGIHRRPNSRRLNSESDLSENNPHEIRSTYRKPGVNRACSVDDHLQIAALMEGGDIIQPLSERREPWRKSISASLADLPRSKDNIYDLDTYDVSSPSTMGSGESRPKHGSRNGRDDSQDGVHRHHTQPSGSISVHNTNKRRPESQAVETDPSYLNRAFEGDFEQGYANYSNDVIDLDNASVGGNITTTSLPRPPKTPSDAGSQYTAPSDETSWDSDEETTVEYGECDIDDVLGSASRTCTPPSDVYHPSRLSSASENNSTLSGSIVKPLRDPSVSSGTSSLSPRRRHISGSVRRPQSFAQRRLGDQTGVPNGVMSGHTPRAAMPPMLNPLYDESSASPSPRLSHSHILGNSVKRDDTKRQEASSRTPLKKQPPLLRSSAVNRACSFDSHMYHDKLMKQTSHNLYGTGEKHEAMPRKATRSASLQVGKSKTVSKHAHAGVSDFFQRHKTDLYPAVHTKSNTASTVCIKSENIKLSQDNLPSYIRIGSPDKSVPSIPSPPTTLPDTAPPPPPPPPPVPPLRREYITRRKPGIHTVPRAPNSSPVKTSVLGDTHSIPPNGGQFNHLTNSRDRMMAELAARLNQIHLQTKLSETDDTSEFSTLEAYPPRFTQTSRTLPTSGKSARLARETSDARAITAPVSGFKAKTHTSNAMVSALNNDSHLDQRDQPDRRLVMQEARQRLQKNSTNALPDVKRDMSQILAKSQREIPVEQTMIRDLEIANDSRPANNVVQSAPSGIYDREQQIGSQRGLFTQAQLESMENNVYSRGRGKVLGHFPGRHKTAELNVISSPLEMNNIQHNYDSINQPEIML